jgi:hypothetical protein
MRKYEVVIRFQSVEVPANRGGCEYFDIPVFQILHDFVNIGKVWHFPKLVAKHRDDCFREIVKDL